MKISNNKNARTLSWLIFSNILKSLSQWALLIILIKFFTTEDVGYFTLGMAIAAPIFMLSEMQMKSVLVVEPENGTDFYKTYLVIRFVATALALIGLIIYCTVFREINWVLLAVVVYKSVESLIDIQYGYYQKKDDMIWMSQIDILKTILTIFACFIVTVFLHKIGSSLISIIIVSALFYLANSTYITHRLAGELAPVSFLTAVDIIKKSLPLGISVLFVSYITNYPRIAIEGHCGPEMLAYFGAYSYLAIGVFQISAPIQTYLRQRLSRYFQNCDLHKFSQSINIAIIGFIFIGITLFLIFLTMGDTIITILYNESYLPYKNIIFVLFFSQLLMAISGIYSTAVLSFNIYTKQAFISGGIFLVVLFISDALIKDNGIYGGAYVSVIAAFISLSCYVLIYIKRIREWKKTLIH